MMAEGAFAFVDCLGWKGIWKRLENQDPTMLLSKLEHIRKNIELQLRNKEGIFEFLNIIPADSKIGFLSDTVIVSLQPKKSEDKPLEDWERGLFISMMSTIIGDVIDMFIKDDPTLTLRGCISYNLHLCHDSFILGPAVDNAAIEEKQVKGAFVWLHPECEQFHEAFLNKYVRRSLERKYLHVYNNESLDTKAFEEKEKKTNAIPFFFYLHAKTLPSSSRRQGNDAANCFKFII